MTSLTEFAGRCATAPAIIERGMRSAVNAAALAVTTSVRAELSSATHGSNRLRNVGLKGARLGVGFDVKGTENPTALVVARGPWQLIERDTKPHTIGPKQRGRRGLRNAGARGERATNRSAIVIPGVGPRVSAHHPGTKGKQPWAKGVEAGIVPATAAFAAEGDKAIISIVKG